MTAPDWNAGDTLGGRWKIEPTPTDQHLWAIWGSGPEDVYAVGALGTILHSRGDGVWTAQASGVSVRFQSVWGTGPNDVYAVGEDVILRRAAR